MAGGEESNGEGVGRRRELEEQYKSISPSLLAKVLDY